MLKEMATVIPAGACPRCGHSQFVVFENEMNLYLTKDSNVIDTKEIDYDVKGMCCNCGARYDMLATKEGFIPMTRLRKILFDYTPHDVLLKEDKYELLENPMMKGGK